MKKIIIVVVLIMICNNMNAQIPGNKMQQSYNRMSFGIKGGLNLSGIHISNIAGDYKENCKNIIGFNVSLFTNISLSKKISLSPEIVYSMKGHKFTLYQTDANGNTIGIITDKNIINYLEIPVIFKFKLIEFSYITTDLYIGPSLGFKIYSNDSHINNFDFCTAQGISILFEKKYVLDLRYTHGFSGSFEF
ncbi:PorT family protein [bacterium]|nr:MAG: PorT family protein [bacterium]